MRERKKKVREEAKMKNLKLAFAGGGPFAEPIFAKLVEDFDNLTLISKEDKPSGRGGKTEKSAIKTLAESKNIPIYEPKNKVELEEIISRIKPDLVVVVSLGIIITENTLKIPNYGFLNVHFSLLPLYRGPSPVQATILSGDKRGGFTIQKVVPEIDAGDIIYKQEIDLSGGETTQSLGKELSDLAALKIADIIQSYISGNITPQPQEQAKAMFSKMIKKSNGKIDWSESAEIIERKVRAYTSWPSAYTYWNGKMLKIIETDILSQDSGERIGTFLDLGDKKCGVQTGNGILVIKKLQLEGKKPLNVSDFLLGNSKIINEVLS